MSPERLVFYVEVVKKKNVEDYLQLPTETHL